MFLEIRGLQVAAYPEGPRIEISVEGRTETLDPGDTMGLIGLLNGFMRGIE